MVSTAAGSVAASGTDTPANASDDVPTEYRPGRMLGVAMSATTLGLALQLGGIVLRPSTLRTLVTDLLGESG